ncbi:MAG: IclR family transcriptional regulator [Acidimicrobiales bacterium]
MHGDFDDPGQCLSDVPLLQGMRFDERNGLSVLARAFRLLDGFEPDGHYVGLAELSRRAELPKATAFRVANQLVELGALERSPKGYRLGMRMFVLGSRVPRQRRLRDAALPLMEDLYEATHETVHLAVRDDLEVLYIEKISGRRSAVTRTQIGTRRPLHCTALGKAILASSDDDLVDAVIRAGLARHTQFTITSPQRFIEEIKSVRSEGVAYDREEYHLGTTCVAAAVLEPGRAVAAALSVSGLTGRFHEERQAVAVRTAALTLTRALGSSPAIF